MRFLLAINENSHRRLTVGSAHSDRLSSSQRRTTESDPNPCDGAATVMKRRFRTALRNISFPEIGALNEWTHSFVRDGSLERVCSGVYWQAGFFPGDGHPLFSVAEPCLTAADTK